MQPRAQRSRGHGTRPTCRRSGRSSSCASRRTGTRCSGPVPGTAVEHAQVEHRRRLAELGRGHQRQRGRHRRCSTASSTSAATSRAIAAGPREQLLHRAGDPRQAGRGGRGAPGALQSWHPAVNTTLGVEAVAAGDKLAHRSAASSRRPAAWRRRITPSSGNRRLRRGDCPRVNRGQSLLLDGRRYPSSARAATNCVDREVEVVGRVGGRHLRADPGGAPRDDRVGEADRVDAAARAEPSAEARRRVTASPIITGTIGCVAGQDVEAELGHPRAEVRGVRAQPVAQLGRALDQVERAQAGGGDRRGDAVREQVRPRALAQELDDLGAGRRRSRRWRRPSPCRACR